MWSFGPNLIGSKVGSKNDLAELNQGTAECSDDEASSTVSRDEGLECPIAGSPSTSLRMCPTFCGVAIPFAKIVSWDCSGPWLSFLHYPSNSRSSSPAHGATFRRSAWFTKATLNSLGKTSSCSGWLKAGMGTGENHQPRSVKLVHLSGHLPVVRPQEIEQAGLTLGGFNMSPISSRRRPHIMVKIMSKSL